jgi:hypothetical protein
MYASIPDQIQQEIISKEGYVLIFYHFLLPDVKNFKNSIWLNNSQKLHFLDKNYGKSVV